MPVEQSSPFDDDEMTELVDADIPRVDLVGKGANGIPRFLIAKREDGAGLMDADFIRDLIGKSEPEPDPDREETVTMTGSPAAIAKLMHEAALRARETNQVAKAEKSTKQINDLPDSDFAYIEPGGHKDDEGKTVPRSLRHFPINDEAHVRNALSRAPQSPFGDKAMPAIRAAAKKFGIEVSKMVGGEIDEGMDGMDPTVVLAAPDSDDAPGDPNDPGSPAWEAIDAATAQKWTSIAVRLKNALGVMAERELLEAASADPDDAEDAWDLQDAQCALDYVIGILASFAVDEQAEAELAIEAMDAVGKALGGFDTAPLDTIEAAAAVRKAGRTLSAANEQAIRDAVASLQKVLASLPAAPVEKTANEEPNMAEPTVSEDVTAESGQEPAMGTKEPTPKVEKALDALKEKYGAPADNDRGETPVTKADDGKKEVVVVYDQKGRLVGIVDPADITPVANAEAEPDDMADTDGASDSGDDSADGASDSDDQTTDLTPQPAGEAGTPADAPSDEDDEAVTKSTTDNDNNDTNLSEMLKSSLLPALEEIVKTYSATQDERVATTGAAVLELADMVETLKGRIGALEEQPAEPKVFTQGAGPRPLPQHLRGHDNGAPAVDVTKAAELKKQLYTGTDAATQQQAFLGLQEMAIAQLAAMRAGQ